MRFSKLVCLIPGLLLAPHAHGQPTPNPSAFVGAYKLQGTTKVKAQATGNVVSALPKQLRTYEREFHPTLDVDVAKTATPDELRFRVATKGYTCELIGTVASASEITFAPGQKCAQTISGDGFSATLDATLASGSASLEEKKLRLETSWNAKGDVVATFKIPIFGAVTKTVPVEGTVWSTGVADR